MDLRRQILSLSLSVTIAAAVALLVPRMSDAVGPSEGVLLGLLVLLSAGLLHEYAARLARQDRTVKQLLLMARGFSSLREEVFDLRARLEGVGTTLVMPAVPRRVPGSARTASPPQGLAAEEQRRLEQVIADAEGRADAKDGGAESGGTKGGGTESGGTESGGTKSDGTAGDLAESEVLATLRRALTEQRVDLYLQPVVALPQRKRTAYECFSRLRSAEGFRLLPEQFIALAERRGLIAALDSNLLSRAVQLVRKVQGDGEDFDFFCNVSGQSLARQDFLRSLADSLARNRVPARNLVFELSQADLKALEGPALMGLRQITQLGCRLSMDRVTDLDLDPEALADVGVDFVKLGADLVLSELAPGHRLLHALGAAGLQVVVEKVESEEALKALADYDLALAQGYLFSMPRLARPAA